MVASIQDKLIGAASFQSQAGMRATFGTLFDRNAKIEDKSKALFNIQAFMETPHLLSAGIAEKNVIKHIQAFTPTTDIPEVFTTGWTAFKTLDNYDMRYELAYYKTNFDEFRSFIEIVSLANGIEVSKVSEGEKVKFSKVTGGRVLLYAQEYGGAIEWPLRMIEDREFNKMFQITSDFRDSMIGAKARAHYTALVVAALSQTVQAVQTGATDLEKNVKAVNAIASTIASDLKDEVGIDPATAPILLYFNADDNIQARMNAVRQYGTVLGNQSSQTISQRQFVYLPTYNLKDQNGVAVPANRVLAVLPQRKIQTADKVLPTQYTEFNPSTFSVSQIGRMSFANGVGDVRQVRAFDLSVT